MLTKLGCPTCRAKFNQITVRAGMNGPVSRTYKVKNRQAPSVPHPDMDGPTQGDLDIFAPGILEFFATDEACGICGTEDSLLQVAVCFRCQQGFHTRCLQAGYESPVLTCPNCDVRLFANGANESTEFYGEEADYQEEAVFNFFRRVSFQNRSVPGGRVINADGLRSSSRLQEARRSREFDQTVARIRNRFFRAHMPSATDDEEAFEVQLVRQSQIDITPVPRVERPQARPRPGTLLSNSASSPPPPPPRSQMSPEEEEAWSILDLVQEDAESPADARSRARRSLFAPSSTPLQSAKRPRSNSSEDLSVGTSSSSGNTSVSSEKKYKRPSRRSSNFHSQNSTIPHTEAISHGAGHVAPTTTSYSSSSSSTSSASNVAASASPTPVQLLLSTIRSSVSSSSSVTPLISPSPVSVALPQLSSHSAYGSGSGSSFSSPRSPSFPSCPASPDFSIISTSRTPVPSIISTSSSPARPSSPVVGDPKAGMGVLPFWGSPRVERGGSSTSAVLSCSDCSERENAVPRSGAEWGEELPSRSDNAPSTAADDGDDDNDEISPINGDVKEFENTLAVTKNTTAATPSTVGAPSSLFSSPLSLPQSQSLLQPQSQVQSQSQFQSQPQSQSLRPRSKEKASSMEPAERGMLTFQEKEKIQALVRDALRPLYRSGTISKDEYTSINKRVSRVMYRHVYRDQAGAKKISGGEGSSGGENSSTDAAITPAAANDHDLAHDTSYDTTYETANNTATTTNSTITNPAATKHLEKMIHGSAYQLEHWKKLVEYYVKKERAKSHNRSTEA